MSPDPICALIEAPRYDALGRVIEHAVNLPLTEATSTEAAPSGPVLVFTPDAPRHNAIVKALDRALTVSALGDALRHAPAISMADVFRDAPKLPPGKPNRAQRRAAQRRRHP